MDKVEPAINGDEPAPADDEASKLRERLEAALLSAPRLQSLPDRLPLVSIERHEALFQPRGEAEGHITELVRSIKSKGPLDPLLVLQIGPTTVLVDGHHRWTAYKRACFPDPVPVTYFPGSVRDAMVAAGEANHKTKLPMTNTEKLDRAWRLVVMGGFSKAQICRGSGVSDGTVGRMRRTAKTLGGTASDYSAWWKADQAARGAASPWQDEDADAREARLAALAEDYARRMGKEFGQKLQGNPEMAARVLAAHFGAMLGKVFNELRPFAMECKGWNEGELSEDDVF